ncbi:hypothetical protein RUND412_006145 [Rhizina undulata]
MPRLVRRQSLASRISSYLNPLDHLLHLATWIESQDWDGFQQSFATPIGLTLNLLCLISRANYSEDRVRGGAQDVLIRRAGGSYSSGWGGGLSYFVCASSANAVSSSSSDDNLLSCAPLPSNDGGSFLYLRRQLGSLAWTLLAISCVNAIYCFTRRKPYRLFESNIEIEPATPSARRVRVDSSPSEIRFFSKLLSPILDSPDDRSHPDKTRDVWEISVWDPSPLSLRIFSLFSPAHALIYFLSFPINTRSSNLTGTPNANAIGVVSTVILSQVLVSLQLYYVQKSFTQQVKDHTIIHKEVLHEYDAKYVHPRLNVIRRDVAIQPDDPDTGKRGSVEVFTPTFNRQGFRTTPNPNYVGYTASKGTGDTSSALGFTPGAQQQKHFSPFKKGPISQPQFGASTSRKSASVSTGCEDIAVGSTRVKGRERGRERDKENERDAYRDTREREREREKDAGGYGGYSRSATVGMNGLVNMSRENSRQLSPSKMPSPLKRGVRGSSYAGSLGTPLGTPSRRHAI